MCRIHWVKVSFLPHELPCKILLYSSIAVVFAHPQNDYLWPICLNEVTRLLVYTDCLLQCIFPSSAVPGLSHAELQDGGTFGGFFPFVLCKELGNHGNSPDCSFCTFIPQCGNQPQEEDNIKGPMYAHFKKKTTLASPFPAVLKRERWQNMWYILYWFNISQTERRYRNSERLFGGWHKFQLKWWVFGLSHLKVLFDVIAHSGVQNYFSFPGRCVRQLDCVK